MMKHKWSITDDLIVYYYHYYQGSELIRPTITDICTKLGMSESSFKARIQNVIAILTNNKQGLSNAAQQTESIVKLLEPSRQNDPNFKNNLRDIVNQTLK